MSSHLNDSIAILDKYKEYTDIDESEIVKIQGSHMITRILSDKSTVLDKSIYLCTHSLLYELLLYHRILQESL